MPVLQAAANRLWKLSNRLAARKFSNALLQFEVAQHRRLKYYLERNADTDFGRKWNFSTINSPAAYRERVPLQDYEDVDPYVNRVVDGQQNVLTREPVIRLMPSSGSSGPAKLIPYTRTLQQEFTAAIAPWVNDLFRTHSDLQNGSAYWSVSPALKYNLKSRVPIGYETDSAYLGGFAERVVNSILAVPSSLASISQIDAFRYFTLLFLLRRPDLRLISVWHPSFLQLLVQALPKYWENLLHDIHDGGCAPHWEIPPTLRNVLNTQLSALPHRSSELAQINPTSPTAIWPRLGCISLWADANAQAGSKEIEKLFPGVFIQAKGLLATEAFVSIPFRGANVLAVTSHYIEFLDNDDQSHSPAHAEVNAEYTIAVTTGGGLYRYRLHDRIKVTGFIGQTPTITFLGKSDLVVDLRGEKLNEAFVATVLQALLPDAKFKMIAPDSRPTGVGYTLYVEGAVSNAPLLSQQLDQYLSTNPHYHYCRRLGQLGPVQIFHIKRDAYSQYTQRLCTLGHRFGDIKPVALSRLDGWADWFNV